MGCLKRLGFFVPGWFLVLPLFSTIVHLFGQGTGTVAAQSVPNDYDTMGNSCAA